MSDALFDAMQRGCMEELEKIGSAHGLSEAEKLAVLKTVGTALAKALTRGGHAASRSGAQSGSKGLMGIGKKIRGLGGKAMENPEMAGALGVAVPASVAAGGAGGAVVS